MATGTTVSRSSATGEPDSTGDGQVNFTIVLNDGYALDSVSVTAGTYKNIKGPTDTGLANTYRITKISGDATITITTVQCEHGTIASGTTPAWTWSDGYGTATLSYTCAVSRDPHAKDPPSAQAAGIVRESIPGLAPDARICLDLAENGGFVLTFHPES